MSIPAEALAERAPFSWKSVAAWSSYDFANSAFVGIMVSFIFPIYFGDTIVADGRGDFYWGMAMSSSMLLVALIGPMLGAMADFANNKKLYLALFTSVTIGCTIGLYFTGPGMIAVAMILFILANAGFEGGLIFYDAFLPEISSEESYGRVSGYGFAAGYIGSFAIILLTKDLALSGQLPETFLVTAAFFFLFALPLFFFVPEKRRKVSAPPGGLIRYGLQKTLRTIRHIRQYPNVSRFLLAFFLYNDGILTIIGFASRFARHTLHFSTGDLIMFFLLIQVVAVIGSLFFGRMADRRGSKFTIGITLVVWVIVAVGAFFSTDRSSFFAVGAIAGIALGSSQAASRSLMAKLTPPEFKSEFFGFYDGFCGKASAVLGPAIFGWISVLFGSQRPATLVVALFFIAGWIILRRVKEEEPASLLLAVS